MNIISVIIPTYKRSVRLPLAINSVLNQTYTPIEIIVVDDNHNDDYKIETRKILEPYIAENKIIYISHNSNQGGCVARNTGAFAAKGDYIAFLDDDDFYEPTKLEEQIIFLNQNISLDACMCSMFRIDENNQQIVSRENIARGETLKETIKDGNLFTSMLLIKKEVFIKLKGFSDIPRFQDKYFHLKFLDKGYKIGVLDKQLLTLVEHKEYRISSASANKVILSLNKIHEFVKNKKNLFTKNEWKNIKFEYLYAKIFTRTQGNLNDRFKSIYNTLQAILFTNNYLVLIKLILRALLPKYLFKQ
ncbi:glycosyltransferase family 2 protein [Algibacter sp. L1A34]|uniref:glycosyltransferase family 2 protein n=1 Tax=Algibacter sp. L1A34 TaxID=2686365 RepID=UPI00131C7CEF|nr:glycosyltransferase family 2 protein [Algibacter sp. L1A34]